MRRPRCNPCCRLSRRERTRTRREKSTAAELAGVVVVAESVVNENGEEVEIPQIVSEIGRDAEIRFVGLKGLRCGAVEEADASLVENQVIAVGGGGVSVLTGGEDRLFGDFLELRERPVGDVTVNRQLAIAERTNMDGAFGTCQGWNAKTSDCGCQDRRNGCLAKQASC